MSVKRSSYISMRSLSLGKGKAVKIWGYDPTGDSSVVCISAAGIEVYSGERGGKQLCSLVWEGLVKKLKN